MNSGMRITLTKQSLVTPLKNTQKCHSRIRNAQKGQLICRANLLSGPAYNKYRSRQDIERDYFKEWERTTLLGEEELNRPMTVLTFLTFLPNWVKFYAIPGPIKFVCYLLWQRFSAAWYKVHKKLVLESAKIDVTLMKRQGKIQPTIDRKRILLRFHNKITLWQDVYYKLQLLQGKA